MRLDVHWQKALLHMFNILTSHSTSLMAAIKEHNTHTHIIYTAAVSQQY